MNRRIPMFKKFIITVTIIISGIPLFAESAVGVLLSKIEKLEEMTTDIRAKVVLTQQKVNQGTKNIEMIYYRRDYSIIYPDLRRLLIYFQTAVLLMPRLRLISSPDNHRSAFL